MSSQVSTTAPEVVVLIDDKQSIVIEDENEAPPSALTKFGEGIMDFLSGGLEAFLGVEFTGLQYHDNMVKEGKKVSEREMEE
jgi:hypothetical protein